eukprot:TRINITY_DN1394_c0_g1_i1.p1 TRINITY_DN1394_c0_g1~~TRINITY_DN1394_c0_g1_i1.p1  ORF type:complete len:311 (-),score=84.97 TRINITY_DN1394_c0_g1_i1:22-825(-)
MSQPQILESIQGNDVPITWDSGLAEQSVKTALSTFVPWKEWVANISKPEHKKEMKVKGVHIQSIDLFGTSKIGFVKFKANVVNKDGKNIAGITFARGGAVGILVILACKEQGKIKEYTLLTVQPRVPAGHSAFREIPAGMLDGDGKFVGVAAKEMKEETGLDIKEEELLCLTDLASFPDSLPGMYPSAGGCDEFLKLYLYRKFVEPSYIHELEGKLSGLIEEGEVITLKVIPLNELWHVPDSKALSALCLYRELTLQNKIPILPALL